MIVEVRNRLPAKHSKIRVDTDLLKTLAIHSLELAGAAAKYHLGVALVTDKQIAVLNARYHHVQGPTDILSFDYGNSEGELVISLDHVWTQTKRFRTTPGRELTLYLIHGILHLHGHEDCTPHGRRRMRAAERRLMKSLARKTPLQGVVVKEITKSSGARSKHFIT
jgi:probable rRNA maturation factor